MESKIGLCCSHAIANAGSPHGCHQTGLSTCCWRYGLFSKRSRFSPELRAAARDKALLLLQATKESAQATAVMRFRKHALEHEKRETAGRALSSASTAV